MNNTYIQSLEQLKKRIEEMFGDLDFNTTSIPIETLIAARSYYVTLFSFQGEAEAAALHQHLLTERDRKNGVIKAKIKHMESGKGVGAAESLAEADCVELYNKEIDAESDWRLQKNRRESCKEISSNLAQVIGVVKQEM